MVEARNFVKDQAVEAEAIELLVKCLDFFAKVLPFVAQGEKATADKVEPIRLNDRPLLNELGLRVGLEVCGGELMHRHAYDGLVVNKLVKFGDFQNFLPFLVLLVCFSEHVHVAVLNQSSEPGQVLEPGGVRVHLK